MIIVDVKEAGSIEKALRKLKRKFDKTKQMKEMRKRRQYSKPSEKRREEMKKARYKERNGLS
jgi:small subunit ribosomal protein S21